MSILIRRVVTLALTLVTLTLLAACGPSNNVRLIYNTNTNAVLPLPGSPSVAVVMFNDERTRQYIGERKDLSLIHIFGRFHARGAVCLARAAEEAPRQLFVHGLGVFDDTMGKVFDKSDLPAGEVALDTRRHIHGTKRLTEPALHAGRQFVVQSHQGIGKLLSLIHI